MSDKIPQQTATCDGCSKKFRRNQTVKGYGIEFPDFAKEHGIKEEEEITLCPECGKDIERIPQV